MPVFNWKTAPDLPTPPPQNGFSLISNQKLFDLYVTMLRSRLIGDHARRLIKRDRLAASGIPRKGQEAALVGIAIDLLPQDTLAPAIWAHAPLSVINPSVYIASDMNQAVAQARNSKASKNNKIVCIFSSSASPFRDAWDRLLNTAANELLPVLFVSWNASLAARAPIHPRLSGAPSFAFPTINVDGTDAVAVYRVASEAIVHARKGNGPTLIQCNPIPSCDPLRNMGNYLIKKELLTPAVKRKILGSLRKELDSNMPIEEGEDRS